MGVGIHAKNGTKGVGMPYSSLQEFRVMVLLAYIEWIKDVLQREFEGDMEYDENEYEQVEELELTDEVAAKNLQQKIDLKHLLSLLEDNMIQERMPSRAPIDARIAYSKFEDLPEYLRYTVYGAIGLYKFINHSDADGYHSFGDAHDILNTLDLIRPYFDDLPDTHVEYTGEWFNIYKRYLDEFMDVFNEAIANETYVEYH